MTLRKNLHCRGLKISLPCDNWITHWRYRTYAKKSEAFDWIDQWERGGQLFFDIGANIGVFSLYAGLRHPGNRIVAFEPEYANLHLLRDNIIKNGLQDHVVPYSIALSNLTGLSYLHIQDLTPGAALHTESQEELKFTHEMKPVVWKTGISTFTLDDFCEKSGMIPNYMKLDVDGTELEILQGGKNILRDKSLKSILLEPPRDPAKKELLIGLLSEAGLRKVGTLTNSDEIWNKRGC